jgi:beta-lactamase regulating signal transducer with metallopeptidase domain
MTVLNAVLFAVTAMLGSCLALGAAWLLAQGKPAAERHLIWTGAFAAMLTLPFAALLLPSQLVWTFVSPAPAAAEIAVSAVPPPAFDLTDAILLIAALWLGGVVFHLGKAAFGGVTLVRLYRRSVPHIPHDLDGAPFRGLRWQLRLRTFPSEAGPVTWGIFRATVLLPKSSVAWPRERLMAVLLHEAAHVRRKDCLARLIALAACALYWPSPLMWRAARLMRRDGESAADDAVLAAGVKPSRYAEHLVVLARSCSAAPVTALTLSMAERSMLDARVKSILDPAQTRSGVTKMDVLKIAAFGIAVTSVLALARPSFAEVPAASDQTAAPVTTPAGADAIKKPVIVHAPDVGNGTLRHHARADDHGVANADVIPPAPPAPPAPPEPGTAIPEPPAPPEPPTQVHTRMHIEFSDAEKDELRRAASAETRRAMAEARKAIADAHIDRAIADALKKVQAEMGKTRLSQAEAEKAVADAHIDQVVADAMRKAEKALNNARVKMTVILKHKDDGAEDDKAPAGEE